MAPKHLLHSFRPLRPGDWLPTLALVFAVVAAPWPLSAQLEQTRLGEATQWNRRMTAPGLMHGSLTFTSPQGARDALFVEAEFRYPALSAAFRPAGEGAWAVLPLREALGPRPGAGAAIAIDPESGLAEATALEGLRLGGRELWSWDARPGPQFLLLADGGARLYHRPPRAGHVRFHDGSTWPIRSLNGVPPEEPGELSIYTGPLAANEPPVPAWPEDLLFHVLSWDEGTDAAARRLHPARVADGPALRLAAPASRASLSVPGTALLAVFKPPLPEELTGLLAGSEPWHLEFKLSATERLAQAAFPVEAILLQAGRPRTEALDEPLDGTLLGVDAPGRRLIALGQTRARRADQLLTLRTALTHLVAEGYHDVALLPHHGPGIVPDVEQLHQVPDVAGRGVRSLLVLEGGGGVIHLADSPQGVRRVEGITVSGTRREFPLNQPARLRDGRATVEPDLAGFWASPVEAVGSGMDRSPRARIHFMLPAPMRIRAVELVHAEAAGFSPEFNLRGYAVRGRRERNEEWTTLLTIRHDTPVGRERLPLPGAPELAELEILVTDPAFLPGASVARLAEVIFWAEEGGR